MSEQEKAAGEPQGDAKAQAAAALEKYGSRIDKILGKLDGDPDLKFRRLAFALGAEKPPQTEMMASAFVDMRLAENPDAEANKPATKLGVAKLREIFRAAREKLCALYNHPMWDGLDLREKIALIAKILDAVIEAKLGYKYICEGAVAAYFWTLDRLCKGILPEAA